MSRQNGVGKVEDISLLQLLPHEIAHLIDLGRRPASIVVSHCARHGERRDARSLGSDRNERKVHRASHILVLETREEEVEVIDRTKLRHKLLEVVLERLGVVVVEDIEVDAMSAAGEEGSSIPRTIRTFVSSIRSKDEGKNLRIEVLPHDHENERTRIHHLQVSPRHL